MRPLNLLVVACLIPGAALAQGSRERPARAQLLDYASSLDVKPPAAPEAPRSNETPSDVRSEVDDGIRITGSAAFVAKTREALVLLRGSKRWAEDRGMLLAIEAGPCSGVDVRSRTYRVGARTAARDVMWYAGTIAHDSRHSFLYQQAARSGIAPSYESYAGVPGEKLALAYQRDVLAELHAPEKYLRYLDGLGKDPQYQNIGKGKTGYGTRDANDLCKDRNW